MRARGIAVSPVLSFLSALPRPLLTLVVAAHQMRKRLADPGPARGARR